MHVASRPDEYVQYIQVHNYVVDIYNTILTKKHKRDRTNRTIQTEHA